VALLKEGIIWRVGDGSKINIWADPWLPNGDTRRPRTIKGQRTLSKVADLINPLNGTWDFQTEDAKAILSISLCEDMEDCIAWHFDPKGNFSVKSAYKVAVMNKNRCTGREAACSREYIANNTVKFEWSKIWKLKADKKLRMFVWRLAHNSLASRMKIQRIGVDLDTCATGWTKMGDTFS
jgi:hypothetical protein